MAEKRHTSETDPKLREKKEEEIEQEWLPSNEEYVQMMEWGVL